MRRSGRCPPAASTGKALALVLAALLTACTRRSPRIAVGVLDAGLGAFLDVHPLSSGQPVRVDEVARTASASYHLVQARSSERPHRHVTHDLTVVVLRGSGILRMGALRRRLAAGDTALVPRDTVHWFASDGADPAVALVIFTPPLDGPDNVPVDPAAEEPRIDSLSGDG